MESDVFDSAEKVFNDRPFAWVGGSPLNFLADQSRVTLAKFNNPPTDYLAHIIDVIKKERCTVMAALPPLLSDLMDRQVHLRYHYMFF